MANSRNVELYSKDIIQPGFAIIDDESGKWHGVAGIQPCGVDIWIGGLLGYVRFSDISAVRDRNGKKVWERQRDSNWH